MELIIATDGSWNKEKKTGGWAYTIESSEGHYCEDSGYSLKTTNNRMEMNAIIQSLLFVKENIQSKNYKIDKITVNTDSAYSIRVINNMLKSDSQTQNMKNSGLINYAVELIKSLNCQVILNHVTGHSVDEQNNYVDRLAVQKRHEAERIYLKSRSEYYADKNTVSYY